MRAAAGKLYAWLHQPSSKLRGFLCCMAASGLLWSSYCAEKTARAYVHHGVPGGVGKELFVACAVARLCRPQSSGSGRGPSDEVGLLES